MSIPRVNIHVDGSGHRQRANRIGAILEKGLHSLMAKHEIIGEVRGRGMMLGIDHVQDRKTRPPVPVHTTANVIYRAYQLGLIFLYVGLKIRVSGVQFPPWLPFAKPICLSDESLCEIGASMC